MSAYLVEPPGVNPHAGILFQHGGAQDRTAFLSEAVMLARRGAVSLLVDAPGAREELNYTRPEIDREMFVRTIINLRRGVDLLAGQANVDADRLGYVGLSFGGYIGGILAGAERRLKAYVLLAALPSMTELWNSSDLSFAVAMRDSLSLEQLDRYIEVTAPFDVIHHIGKAAPAPLFFQFATEDEIVAMQDALRLFAAGSEPKMMKWYESGHPLLASNMDGRNDRARWLSEQIGLM